MASFGLFSITALHAAPSASELLEQGIYSEETKGDLEAAITIYQQLLAETKSTQSLAAEARFRLGQCFLKKNRTADAVAAFQKLIRDYPSEKELVAKARAYLPADLALGPIPWVDGERMQLIVTLATGIDIGTVVYRANLVELEGRKGWRVGARMYAGTNSVSSVDADAQTFLPIASSWKHGYLGEATATYGPEEVEIRKSTNPEPSKVVLEKITFDNEQAMHAMRRLPLAVGYKATMPLISSLGASAVIPLEVEVVGQETLTVPAGQFDCFKVQLNVGQTFWFATDAHRYLVRFDAGGVTASLASVTQRKIGEPVPFADEALGISFTAPPEWVVHKRLQPAERNHQNVHLLDPAADAEDVSLRLFTTSALAANSQKSPRVWAEAEFTSGLSQHLKELTIRGDSWKNYNIAGRLGVTYLADYKDKEKPMVLRVVHAVGPKYSERFTLACPAEKFEALDAAFSSILASYRAQ